MLPSQYEILTEINFTSLVIKRVRKKEKISGDIFVDVKNFVYIFGSCKLFINDCEVLKIL